MTGFFPKSKAGDFPVHLEKIGWQTGSVAFLPDARGMSCVSVVMSWRGNIMFAVTGGDVITTSATYDMIGRVTIHSLTAPEGAETVEYGYDGRDRKISQANPHLSTTSLTDGTTQYVLDGLSRTITVTQPDASSVGTDYTQFPYATVTDEAGKKRKTKMDGAGRLVQVIEDPAGLAFESDYQYDAAGNMLCVEQHGGATGTGCSSNPNNDPTSAWRVRRFTYDDASRLLTATNPESGAITYTYDANGNVVTKTDARGIITCFGDWSSSTSTCNGATGYDVLNRLLKKTYSDGTTPTVQFGYDGVAIPSGCTTSAPSDTDSYPLGQRTSMCDGSGATSWTHDQMGRILQEDRTIGSATAKYNNDSYNPDGSVASVTALGYNVTYTYDKAGRPITAENSADPFNFVTSATYAPPGELGTASLGATPITVTNYYNDRLQPILLSAAASTTSLFSECFDFHLGVAISTSPCTFSAYTSGNNGNVYKITNNRDSTHGRDQNFIYDSLNRIQQAYSTGSGTYSWGETFGPTATGAGVPPSTPGIDSWGNLTNRSGVTGKTYTEPLSVSAGVNNRLASFGYDSAGNMTSNSSTTYVYDAESRLVWTSGYRYIYDGDGQRVEKCAAATSTTPCPTSGTSGTLYWRGTAPDAVAETDLSGNLVESYIFFGGQRIARRDASTKHVHFYFSDHLGTHGVVENATGTVCEQDIDYYPYGGAENDYCSSTSVPQNYKFTGKERDTESGLDNFGARYNASSLGRFMTPDWSAKTEPIPYSRLDSPQSLDLYSYVLNNPLSNVDTDGHACSGVLGNTGSGFCTRATEYGKFDASPGVQSKTRFFAAANAVSQALADVAAWSPAVRMDGISAQTATFLEGVGEKLQGMNEAEAHMIASGGLSGPGLDQQLVHNEQTAVQGQLDSLRQSNPDAYKATISEINGALNPGALGKEASSLFPTDKAFQGVLDEVRKGLGRNIDFSKQGDREAIGNALIQHVRQTGGCDVNGKRQPGC